MKKTSYFFLIISILLLSCERDDICAEGTPTTPRLLIDFFDILDNDELKTVPRLTIYADDPDVSQPTEEDQSGAILVELFELDRVFNTNANSAGLPLQIGIEGEIITIRYFLEKDTNLRLDEDNPATSDVDILQITYIPQFEYVSRACGFKSVFTNIEVELMAGDDGTQWTQNIRLAENIENAIIENEDNTHVQIFH